MLAPDALRHAGQRLVFLSFSVRLIRVVRRNACHPEHEAKDMRLA